MKNETAEYKLTLQDGKEIIFESDLPAELMDLYLKENQNIWNEKKFINFIKSFTKKIYKYSFNLL